MPRDARQNRQRQKQEKQSFGSTQLAHWANSKLAQNILPHESAGKPQLTQRILSTKFQHPITKGNPNNKVQTQNNVATASKLT
jgi:hypothetical protein